MRRDVAGSIPEKREIMETSNLKRPATANPWGILALLAIALLISFIDRTSLSSALADKGFVKEFGADQRGTRLAQLGLLLDLRPVPAGDGLGGRPLWRQVAVRSLLRALVHRHGPDRPGTTLTALIVMRLLIGAAEAIVMPASYRWMGNNFEESQKGLAVGLFTMGGKIGPAIGAPIAAWMIVNHSWQLMFIATGLVGLLWLVPWLRCCATICRPRRNWRPRRGKASSVSFGSLLVQPGRMGRHDQQLLLRLLHLLLHDLDAGLPGRAARLSLENSGLYTFFSFAGIAIVATFAGWAADRFIARGHDAVLVRKSFVVAGFIGGTTVLLGAYASTLQMALFWNVLSLSLLGLVTANNTHPVQADADPQTGDRPEHRPAAGRDQPGRRRVGQPVGLAAARGRQLRAADAGDLRSSCCSARRTRWSCCGKWAPKLKWAPKVAAFQGSRTPADRHRGR
jgi:ACS family D-galactonate transporter-like MFS transporter